MSERIPPSHPRYASLLTRKRMSDALRRGLIHETGMIAHGRGEAFDYLLGERSPPTARHAVRAAAAALLLAKRPLLSANGNVVALAAPHLVRLSKHLRAPIEVNLFHRTQDRVKRLERELRRAGATRLIAGPLDARIPRLDSDRARCHKEGLYSADVVLVPLEDGDRAQALRRMRKTVIAIDLNPLSRTSRTASITIVDELTRALHNLSDEVRRRRRLDTTPGQNEQALRRFENRANLSRTLAWIARRLSRE